MEAEVREEFERLEGRITWAAKVAIGIGLAVAIPVSTGAIVVYAQTNKSVSENQRQDKDIEKLNGTRDKVLQIEPRLESIEKAVGAVQDEQRQQRSILEEIRREVRK